MRKNKKLTLEQREVANVLKGKRISRVTMNAFASDDGPATDPVVWFTDGTCLRFVVQETNGGEYGIDLVYPGRTR